MATAHDELLAGCRRAQLAEVAWLDGAGRPDLTVAVPLVLDDAPTLALTYDRLELARAVAASGQVALTLATPALLRGATPVAATGHAVLEEDPRGERFREQLLDQELAKYPPARRFADSPLLQRENWWYLPRLVLRLTGLGGARTLDAPGTVAAVRDGDRLAVEGCDLDDLGDHARIRRAELPDGPAALLEHGGEVPELEFRWHRRLRGDLLGGQLAVVERDEIPPPAGRPGVVTRWRDERRLGRACRLGLRRAGHD